ncbi:alpha/beta fold hydrolase [Nocardia sp. NPDC051052]|uniref:alpha/beta fold hydrolase n=1 Tax=Nocardia sp. NPDC051052 TaxID=3364322 RepID=UPI003791B69C
MKKNKVQTKLGKKEILRTGKGNPVLVVHGGPGMDYSYMTETLIALESKYELFFYEQTPEAGVEDPNPTASKQVDELEDILNSIATDKRSIRIIAHSWGTYLALEVARRPAISKVSHMALISPMPLTWDRFASAGERLVSRVDEDDLPRVDQLESEGTEESGKKLMELVSYAYLAGGHQSTARPSIGRYNPTVNASVSASIEGYNQIDVTKFLEEVEVALIYGEDDYFIPSGTQELSQISEVSLLKNCGHFPFSENPTELISTLNKSLT